MRLIDADALKAYIDAQEGRHFIGCTVGEALKIMTGEQPTIDAVHVVWCRDCKHNKTVKCPMRVECYEISYGYSVENSNEPNDFCSRAERKDKDETD